MKLSAFTDILDCPFEEALDRLAGIGLDTIDLRTRIGPHNVDTIDAVGIKSAAGSIARRSLKIGCVASWGVNSLDGRYDPGDQNHRADMRRRTEHLASLASDLGARSVRVYSFKRPQGAVTEEHRRDNASFLAELAWICAERSRILLIENEPPTLTATCDELGDLVRRNVPDNLKINWDIVNGWRAGEVPWAPGVFRPIAGRVAHVHVKGARANPDGSFATMAVPGNDDVPHAELVRMLADGGFDGILTIDPHYGQFAESDKLPEFPDPVLEVVKRTMAFLKTVSKESGDG